jgi:hypothetical protein
MATTTPNFGWSVPTSTDLVKDGATAIETLGDSIDASLVDLKGGTTGQVLAKASATDMDFTWATDASGIPATIFDAKGDIIAATAADTASRLAVGANNTVLTADSAEATGLKWATPSGSAKTYTLVNSGGTSLTGTSVSITGLSTYDDLLIIVRGASCTTSGQSMYMSVNSVTSANSYTRAGSITSFSATYAVGISDTENASDTEIRLGTMSSNAASTVSGGVSISGCRGTGVKPLDVTFGSSAGGGNSNGAISYKGVINATTAISSVQIFSGTFDAGTIFVYGAV